MNRIKNAMLVVLIMLLAPASACAQQVGFYVVGRDLPTQGYYWCNAHTGQPLTAGSQVPFGSHDVGQCPNGSRPAAAVVATTTASASASAGATATAGVVQSKTPNCPPNFSFDTARGMCKEFVPKTLTAQEREILTNCPTHIEVKVDTLSDGKDHLLQRCAPR